MLPSQRSLASTTFPFIDLFLFVTNYYLLESDLSHCYQISSKPICLSLAILAHYCAYQISISSLSISHTYASIIHLPTNLLIYVLYVQIFRTVLPWTELFDSKSQDCYLASLMFHLVPDLPIFFSWLL